MAHFFKRAGAMALAVCMTAAVFAGCGSETTGTTTMTIDGKTENFPYVMKVDGKKVSLDEYKYYFLNEKTYSDYGDESYWNDTTEATLKESVEGYIKEKYAIESLAKENGVSLTDDEKQKISDYFDQIKASYDSDEAFQAALANLYVTEDVYKDILLTNQLASDTYTKLYGVDGTKAEALEDVVNRVKTDYAHVLHVLILSSADNAEQTANEVLQKAQNGEDFEQLVKDYNQDTGMPDEGYYFTTGEMVQEFEDAAFALKEGEISGVVKTSYGYHIIKRLPIDEQYIKDNFSTFSDKTDEFWTLVDDRMAELKVEYASNYDKVNVKNMTENFLKTTDDSSSDSAASGSTSGEGDSSASDSTSEPTSASGN